MVGPRGEHTRDDFVELVVAAAEEIARAEGLRGLALRRVAAAVGYAPNSLYNAVGGLDDIILRVNARTLDRLRVHLESVLEPATSAAQTTLRLADAYLDFVLADPKLWSLLFEHVLPSDAASPEWFEEALRRPTALVAQVLEPLIPDSSQKGETVAALWASLHGIASLATSGKLAMVSAADPHDLARLIVEGFLSGIGNLGPGRTRRIDADAARSE